MTHVLLWIGIWISMAFLLSGADRLDIGLPRSAMLVVGQMILVYANAGILFPRLYVKNHYGWYLLAGLASVVLVGFLIQEFSDEILRIPTRTRPRRTSTLTHTWYFMLRSFPLFMAFLLSTIYQITGIARRREQETIQLQKEKLETELKFLKTQTNPHFLFNALNNIYTLTLIKSDKAPDYLMVLSDMLRYMLYECNAEKVPLAKEIAYLKNYISLQMLKDSEGLNIQANFDENHPTLQIAPMLFVPLVENAFKHSKIEDREHGWIKLQLRVEGKVVELVVENSLPKADFSKDQAGGIGLTNVARQLELLYSGKYEMQTEVQEESFYARLKIDLA